MKRLSDWPAGSKKPSQWLLPPLLWIALIWPAGTWGQSALPGGRLHFLAQGTGQTTGPVVALTIYNGSPAVVRTVVGDCFIPSTEGYQGYLIPGLYPVTLPPFRSVRIQLEGYCANIHLPAVTAGEPMADVTQWATWAGSDPLPAPGWQPGPGFEALPAAPQGDPLSLCYPGTSTAFPYRIDFNRHPANAARLLLHAAYAAGQAFDELLRSEKLRTARPGHRAEFVQQVVWAFAARLEGRNYNRDVFAAQWNEGLEEQANQFSGDFTEATVQQARAQVQDLWSDIELTGVQAKLVPPGGTHPPDVFQEQADYAAGNAAALLTEQIERAGNTGQAADLIPALLYLHDSSSEAALEPATRNRLQQRFHQAWMTWLDRAADRASADSPEALPELLGLLGLLHNKAGALVDSADQSRLLPILMSRLQDGLRRQAQSLKPSDPDYLRRRRMLKSWSLTPWYIRYCQNADPLGAELARAPHRPSPTGRTAAGTVSLDGPQWKFLSPYLAAAPHHFPWWIPAVGGPVIGVGVYLALKNGKDSGQPPVVTCPADVTVECGSEQDLAVTGVAQAASSCDGGISTAFTDDLSQVANCEGKLLRTWVATDSCGHSASCLQTIAVIPAPCTFTPTVTVTPGTCGNCNGSASATVDLPGSYTYQWSNGATGPSVNLLCPGGLILTVANAGGCTMTLPVSISSVPLILSVVQTIQPSSPTAADGSIVLMVAPPNALPPFQVRVNGLPAGMFTTPNIVLNNLSAGHYLIQVVDQGGSGCGSNFVNVELVFGGVPPPAGELQDASLTPSGLRYFVFRAGPAPAGILLRLNLSGRWEANWQANWQNGLPYGPVSRFAAGLRRYNSAGAGGEIYGEASAAYAQTRIYRPWEGAIRSNGWSGWLGGGWRLPVLGYWRIDMQVLAGAEITPGRLQGRLYWRFGLTVER